MARPHRPPAAWPLGVVALLALATLVQAAADPPPIPGHPNGARDELGRLPREWAITDQTGTVFDLVGAPQNDPAHGEIAFRLHGDIGAIEGAYVVDPSRPGAQPVFNTGARLHRVAFEPPLGLADGGRLAFVRVPALDWNLAGQEAAGDIRVAFRAPVPPPQNGTSSPGGTSDAANGTGASVGQMQVQMAVRATPDADEDVTPATVRLLYVLHIRLDALSAPGRAGLDDTDVTFTFLFDFGGSASGRLVTEGPTGIYLYRANTSAFLRVPGLTHATASGPGPAATAGLSTLFAPLALNATASRSQPEPKDGNITFLGTARLGYMADLAEAPGHTHGPDDPDAERDAPGPAPLLLLLAAAGAAACRRRTEAPR